MSTIKIWANGEYRGINLYPHQSWRQLLINTGSMDFDNGVHLSFSTTFENLDETQLLCINNVTNGTGFDQFEIELITDGSNPSELAEYDSNPSYTLVDNSPAHATFNLLQTTEVAA